jgi:hypothetical protein
MSLLVYNTLTTVGGLRQTYYGEPLVDTRILHHTLPYWNKCEHAASHLHQTIPHVLGLGAGDMPHPHHYSRTKTSTLVLMRYT